MDALDTSEESVLQLVATPSWHALLDHPPVLTMLIDEGDQLQVVLHRPFLVQQVRTEVVLVVVLQLLIIPVCMRGEVLGKKGARARQSDP